LAQGKNLGMRGRIMPLNRAVVAPPNNLLIQQEDRSYGHFSFHLGLAGFGYRFPHPCLCRRQVHAMPYEKTASSINKVERLNNFCPESFNSWPQCFD
jgi:hypothetical protein